MTDAVVRLRRSGPVALALALAVATVAVTALRAGDDSRRATRTTLAVAPASSTAGQAVTLTATVAPEGGEDRPAGSVEYFDGPRPLGVAPLAREGDVVATLQVGTLQVGAHQITARYVGHPSFFPSTSPPVGHVVTPQQ